MKPTAKHPAGMYEKAVAIVREDRRASTSYLQRRMQIGYTMAGDLIEAMEKNGVITEANHLGKREIL